MGRLSQKRVVSAATLAISALLLTACALGDAHDVAKGDDPWNEDKEVRFRTTYYFRVFDECEELDRAATTPGTQDLFPDKRGKKLTLLKDSIYRFRMTGKASSLFQRVLFEAGTVRASEIDPFGATVAVDETNRQLYVKSREQIEQDARFDAGRRRLAVFQGMLDGMDEKHPLYADTLALVRNAIREIGGTAAVAPGLVGTPQEILKIRSDAYDAAIAARKSYDEIAKIEAPKPPPSPPQAPPAVTAIEGARDGAPQLGTDPRTALANFLGTVGDHIGSEAGAASPASALRLARQVMTAARSLDAGLEDGRKALLEELQKLKGASSPDAKAIEGKAKELASQEKAVAAARPLLSRMVAAEASIQDGLRRVYDMRIALLNRESGIARATLPADRDAEAAGCPAHANLRRGFQIMGPEGVRTFNQDERLVMAMASDGKPLIGLLKELSSKILDERAPNPSDQLLPLAQERLRLVNAERIAERQRPSAIDIKSAQDAISLIVGAFNGTAK